MALTSKYQQFLARPTQEALAPGAAINYLPSLTTITEPAVIIKHLNAQTQQLKKKENFLNVVYGDYSICVEAETTIDFINGGGTFLPGLDDNFLADRTVTLPVIHIVDFSDTQKIQQIRLMWDQGSLLKSVDVIGARGKTWPLYDGKDQVKSIANSVDAAQSASTGATSKADVTRQGRHQSRGGANADKHSSRDLFSPTQTERQTSSTPSVAPPSTAKPPPRDYHELFGGGSKDGRSESPSKGKQKIGAGKHYHENRLFDSTPVDLTGGPGSPEKKGYSKKYDHFDFGEPDENEGPRPPSSKHSKHGPQWDFKDFETPEKVRERKLPHHERNFGWSDDEEEAKKPMVHRTYVPHARPDAEAHFDFNDEATPTQNRPKSRGQNAQQVGLYEDHIHHPSGPPHHHGEKDNSSAPGSGSGPATSEKMPLGNITNVNTKGHNKTFGSQFDINDASPTTSGRNENVGETRKKAAGVMQANWDMYDESPKDKIKGINIQGDGMGSRKKPGEKHWWDYENE